MQFFPTTVLIIVAVCASFSHAQDELIGLDIPSDYEGDVIDIWDDLNVADDPSIAVKDTLLGICEDYDLTVNGESVDCSSIKLSAKNLKVNEHTLRKREVDDTPLEGSGEEPKEETENTATSALEDPKAQIPEEAPKAEEASKAEESPIAPEAPKDEASKDEAAPVAKEAPEAEETPKAEGAPIAEEALVAAKSPIVEEASEAGEESKIDDAPVVEEAPEAKDESKVEEAPKAEEEPQPEEPTVTEQEQEISQEPKIEEDEASPVLKKSSENAQLPADLPVVGGAEIKPDEVKKDEAPKQVEAVDDQQSGVAVIHTNEHKEHKDGVEGSDGDKALQRMDANANIKAANNEPNTGESANNIEKAGKDTTVLIVLFAIVISVGVLAFAYNYVRKQKKRRQNEAILNNGNVSKRSLQNLANKSDVEQGTELKPLMKNGEKITNEYLDNKENGNAEVVNEK